MIAGTTTGAVIGLVLAGGLLLVLTALTSRRPARTAGRGALSMLAAAGGLAWLTPGRLVLACAACALTGGMVALLVSALLVVALISAAVSASVPVVALRRRARLHERAVRAAWPEAVDSLVSAVRAGMSLAEALGALALSGPAPLRPAFAGFLAEHRATGSLDAAFSVLQAGLADPVADRVVAALTIARDVGGTDLGRVLRDLSKILREDARMRGEIEGRQSWTVSAARMAVAAPWITLALLCTRPEAVQSYRSPLGACVLVAAAAVSVIAYRLMMRIGRLPVERRLAS